MKDQERLHRYDFQGKSNRFMEFISREMMRNKHHKSHVQQPIKKNNSRIISSKSKANANVISDIYSQPQIARQRRGASVLKNTSKNRYINESSTKIKKEIKDTSINFYEGIKANEKKTQVPRTIGILNEDEVEIEQLHYQMVKMNQNVKRLQKQT